MPTMFGRRPLIRTFVIELPCSQTERLTDKTTDRVTERTITLLRQPRQNKYQMRIRNARTHDKRFNSLNQGTWLSLTGRAHHHYVSHSVPIRQEK